jgi:hypothetical protein
MKKIKKLILIMIILTPLLVYSSSITFEVLCNIALEGKLEKSTFYLNSQNCWDKTNLHVAYQQKDNILIFGYFNPQTGVIKNFLWDVKKGETTTLSNKFDEIADPKKATKISELEMQDAALRFRTDWLMCK